MSLWGFECLFFLSIYDTFGLSTHLQTTLNCQITWVFFFFFLVVVGIPWVLWFCKWIKLCFHEIFQLDNDTSIVHENEPINVSAFIVPNPTSFIVFLHQNIEANTIYYNRKLHHPWYWEHCLLQYLKNEGIWEEGGGSFI